MHPSVKAGLHISLLVSLGCSNPGKQSKTLTEAKTVAIELSIPHGESGRTLFIGAGHNPIGVIFHNNTDSAARMYEDWNSWGYYNISFEIETPDSIYHVRKKQRVWWKNFPSYNVINPGESLVFNFSLDDSVAESPDRKRKILRGSYQGWTGLPHKSYDSAKIRALYELNGATSLPWSHGAIDLDYDDMIIRSFIHKLNSKQYNIRIDADQSL
jgi:hypothetical protein